MLFYYAEITKLMSMQPSALKKSAGKSYLIFQSASPKTIKNFYTDINPFYSDQTRHGNVETHPLPLIFLTEMLSILSAKKYLTLGGCENFDHGDWNDEVIQLHGRFANEGIQ